MLEGAKAHVFLCALFYLFFGEVGFDAVRLANLSGTGFRRGCVCGGVR
jgi:hypothetical protein